MLFDLESCSFVTIPNAFRQCAISLRRIHSASNYILLMTQPQIWRHEFSLNTRQ